MNSRTADVNCVTSDVPKAVRATKAGTARDVRRDGIPVRSYIDSSMRIAVMGTECADPSCEPILQQYLGSDAMVLAGCTQWMAILIKPGIGPMPQCVKAILGDRVDISSTQCRPVGWESMSAECFQRSHSVGKNLTERRSRFNNLCLRIGYPLPESHRLLTVGVVWCNQVVYCLAASAASSDEGKPRRHRRLLS